MNVVLKKVDEIPQTTKRYQKGQYKYAQVINDICSQQQGDKFLLSLPGKPGSLYNVLITTAKSMKKRNIKFCMRKNKIYAEVLYRA